MRQSAVVAIAWSCTDAEKAARERLCRGGILMAIWNIEIYEKPWRFAAKASPSPSMRCGGP
jgi:hypothetical protein